MMQTHTFHTHLRVIPETDEGRDEIEMILDIRSRELEGHVQLALFQELVDGTFGVPISRLHLQFVTLRRPM